MMSKESSRVTHTASPLLLSALAQDTRKTPAEYRGPVLVVYVGLKACSLSFLYGWCLYREALGTGVAAAGAATDVLYHVYSSIACEQRRPNRSVSTLST